MNRHILVLVASLLLVACGCESMGMKGSESKDVDEVAVQSDVKAKSRDYIKALTDNDLAALERIWADNLVFINGAGMMQTKQQRLADLRSADTRVQSVDINDETVRCGADGKIAAHFSRCTIKGKYNGKDTSGDFRTTIGWVKRDGVWQITLIQLTPIATK